MNPEFSMKYHMATPPIKYGKRLCTFRLLRMNKPPIMAKAINKFIKAIVSVKIAITKIAPKSSITASGQKYFERRNSIPKEIKSNCYQ
jgi:hypothetical protein